MRLLILILILTSCRQNEKKIQDISILLEWRGNQDKPLPILIFTNISGYVSNKNFSETFILSGKNLALLEEKLKDPVDCNKGGWIKVTVQKDHVSTCYFYKENVADILNEFKVFFIENNLSRERKEIEYFQSYIGL